MEGEGGIEDLSGRWDYYRAMIWTDGWREWTLVCLNPITDGLSGLGELVVAVVVVVVSDSAPFDTLKTKPILTDQRH